MKIQDVEIKTGLDRATIRFYEKENILTPERSENGYRNYSDADVELLLKIKLLRKIGVNLLTIKALQQGRENLTEVLTQQVQILGEQIQNDSRAKAVCIQMQNDGAQYLTLDSEVYLQKLNMPQEKAGFQEDLKEEIHPVRRLIAGEMDMLLIRTMMNILLIMVFRIRPCSKVFMLCIQIISYATVFPLEAMMLYLWGTTPGKWLMGMRLEDPNGGKLSFSSAFIRTWHVTFAGLGLIPCGSFGNPMLLYRKGRGHIGMMRRKSNTVIQKNSKLLVLSHCQQSLFCSLLWQVRTRYCQHAAPRI